MSEQVFIGLTFGQISYFLISQLFWAKQIEDDGEKNETDTSDSSDSRERIRVAISESTKMQCYINKKIRPGWFDGKF